jgi:hypothetical protein
MRSYPLNYMEISGELHARPLYPPWKCLRYASYGRVNEYRAGLDSGGKTYLFPFPGIELTFLDHSVHSLVFDKLELLIHNLTSFFHKDS